MTRLVRVFASVVLVCTTLGVLTLADTVMLPAPAEATQATGGTGKYRNMVQWVRWGDAGQQIAGTTRTVRERSTIAGQTLETTCTISGVSPTGALESYRPGTWQGDGFDNLYNIGGQGGANQLVVGLSNRTQGRVVDFDFTCSATLGGEPFELAGLVMADAEASGASEYIGATIGSGATWRIIERVRGAACTLDTYAHRSTQNRLELYGPAGNSCESDAALFPDRVPSRSWTAPPAPPM